MEAVQNGLDIISLLSTGGDAAQVAVLWLLWKQSQKIQSLKERLIAMEIHIGHILGGESDK